MAARNFSESTLGPAVRREASRRMSTTRMTGIFRSSTRAVRRSSAYLPVVAL